MKKDTDSITDSKNETDLIREVYKLRSANHVLEEEISRLKKEIEYLRRPLTRGLW